MNATTLRNPSQAGHDALKSARKNTLILVAFLAVTILSALMFSVLLSQPFTEKRLAAIRVAWSSESPVAADMLASCLVTRGKGRLAGSVMLLSHVKDCETNLQGMAFAVGQGLEPQQDMPAPEAVNAAIKAREAVFSRTLLPNPADF